jgi:hypothetical protein
MMRTIEVSIVIVILTTAFIASAFFGTFSPQEISPLNLRQLALTTLQIVDSDKSLSETAFKPPQDPAWTDLQIALAASLPPNIDYNLTVYDIYRTQDTTTYRQFHSITSSVSGLAGSSEAATYLVTSTNSTFATIKQKIRKTLYVLNCSDSNGWWITGYTGQSLAADVVDLLSPYFNTTVIVQSTAELESLLDGSQISGLPHESVSHAVVINTFGESVPIPSTYADLYSRGSYAEYCYELGKRVNQYDWTWVSIVGYPFYYVSNTVKLADSHNSWGIYGMNRVGPAGLNCFLRGLDVEHYPSYGYDSNSIARDVNLVYFSDEAYYYSNYYGIYPAYYQTATRALPASIQVTYHLTAVSAVFDLEDGCYGAATFEHEGTGALTAIGLTRTPDIRVTALATLIHDKPVLYKSEFTLTAGERPTQRLLVLQLSQQGGG